MSQGVRLRWACSAVETMTSPVTSLVIGRRNYERQRSLVFELAAVPGAAVVVAVAAAAVA
jgi:hypothetical protein